MGQSYIRGMDGLRAIGVLCVLIAHFWPRPNSMLDYFHFGRFGVVLFFVLSGFLVVKSLVTLRVEIDSQRLTRVAAIKKFYYNRALRIFPIYYLALAVVYFVQASPDLNNHIQWLLLYVSNYGYWFDINFMNTGHFWTLAVEEQFYLIIPFFVIFVDKKYFLKTLMAIFFGSLILKGFISYQLWMLHDENVWGKATQTLWGCLEGLCFGAMLAIAGLNSKIIDIFSQTKIIIGSFLLIVSLSVYKYICLKTINTDFVYSFIAHIPFALFSLALVSNILRRPNSLLVNLLENSAIRWVGKISYGIYIFHFLAKPLIADWVLHIEYIFPSVIKPYALFIIGSTVSIAVASLSFVLIERPILRLKTPYWSSAKGEVAAV